MRKWFVILVLLVVTCSVSTQAQITKIGSKSVHITLPQDFDIKQAYTLPLLFINTAANARPVYFEISSFISRDNRSAMVELYADDRETTLLVYDGATAVSDSSIVFRGGEIREFRLSIRIPDKSAEYNGTLVIHSLAAGPQNTAVESESITFIVRRHAPAQKLLPEDAFKIHHGSDKLMYVKRFLWGIRPDLSDFSLNIANISKADTIKNLVVKPISIIKTDNDHNLNQQFEPDSFITSIQSLSARTSKNIVLPFPPVYEAGTYTTTFSIESDNLEPQQFLVNLQLKRPALYAALIILIGSLLSYTVTRGFINLKKRGDRNIHIRKIRKESEDLTDINRIVRERIRSLASVAKDLNQKFFFNNNDKTLSFLEIADFLATVSQRKEAIWKAITKKDVPPGLVEEVKDYFKEIDRLAMKYDVAPYKNDITANLNDAEKCTSDDKGAAYALELQNRIKKILTKQLKPVHSKNNEIAEFESNLRQQLTERQQKENLSYTELKPAEIILRMYKLVTEYRIRDQILQKAISGFLAAEDAETGLQEAMKIAYWNHENQAVWEEILNNKNDISIKAPLKPTTNEVGIYSIDFGSEKLNNSYLVRKLLTYYWSFTPAHQYKLTKPVLKIVPEAKPPRVRDLTLVNKEFSSQEELVNMLYTTFGTENKDDIQKILEKAETPNARKIPVPPSNDMKSNSVPKYFPEGGSWNISVTVHFPKDLLPEDDNMITSIAIEPRKIEVRENEDIIWYRQWNKYEIGLSGIAFLFAVFSGLQSEYFRKPDFGSWDDFLTLFIWAVGFDQGKNFLTLVKDMRDKQKEE